jgi:hypothetical protein
VLAGSCWLDRGSSRCSTWPRNPWLETGPTAAAALCPGSGLRVVLLLSDAPLGAPLVLLLAPVGGHLLPAAALASAALAASLLTAAIGLGVFESLLAGPMS